MRQRVDGPRQAPMVHLPASESRWSVFATDLGWMALLGGARGLFRVLIGHPHADAAWLAAREVSADAPPADWSPELRRRLCRYAAGQLVEFDDVPLPNLWATEFQRRVIAALRRVTYGRRTSYGELARRVGHPQAARAVGGVMASNPTPLIVPCHRVLGAGERLGGFSAPTGVTLKRRLLDLEASVIADAAPTLVAGGRNS